MKTRNLIIIVLAVIIIAAAFFTVRAIRLSNPQKSDPAEAASIESQEFDDFNENIIHTALSKDSIPPLENPEYISVDNADFMNTTDKVFIYEANEGTYIYPRKILVWHEIVNDTIDNESVSITYCPLTGSVIGYEGSVGLHKDNTYGTSGKLLNSNLVMYDRITDSYIPQILGVAINSGLAGNELSTFPVYWTDWIDASAEYPDAKVLTLATGFERDYFIDPYGSYDPKTSNSYYTSGDPMFIVMNPSDGTFHDKKVITGVKFDEHRIALDPEMVRAEKVYNFKIGNAEAVAFYDDNLDIVRVYRILDDRHGEFNYDGVRITDSNGTVWEVTGISENGETLDHITHFDVMWFAWYAYYPDTEVLQ